LGAEVRIGDDEVAGEGLGEGGEHVAGAHDLIVYLCRT
jgi:hypothetical protein